MIILTGLLRLLSNKFLSLLPENYLEKFEDVVQKQLGKGSGAWSTKSEARIVSEFIKSLSLREVVAIDAGANLGNWSAEIIDYLPNASVIAFEPSRDAFTKLSERFSANEKIRIVNIALGKENKTSKLYADKSGSGLGSLTKRRLSHFNIEFTHEEEIEIQTLDSWVASANFPTPPPNVLKMDVEGHEMDVLLGATATLKNIQLVQFEFGGGNIDTKTFFQDFWYFFEQQGFEVYRLTPNKPKLIKEYSERDESFRATNYIAIRKSYA
jgi:FkbM family methyltransferase